MPKIWRYVKVDDRIYCPATRGLVESVISFTRSGSWVRILTSEGHEHESRATEPLWMPRKGGHRPAPALPAPMPEDVRLARAERQPSASIHTVAGGLPTLGKRRR